MPNSIFLVGPSCEAKSVQNFLCFSTTKFPLLYAFSTRNLPAAHCRPSLCFMLKQCSLQSYQPKIQTRTLSLLNFQFQEWMDYKNIYEEMKCLMNKKSLNLLPKFIIDYGILSFITRCFDTDKSKYSVLHILSSTEWNQKFSVNIFSVSMIHNGWSLHYKKLDFISLNLVTCEKTKWSCFCHLLLSSHAIFNRTKEENMPTARC